MKTMCKSCGGPHEPKKCMKGKSYKDMEKATGDIKGVHQPSIRSKNPGVSAMGQQLRELNQTKEQIAAGNAPKGSAAQLPAYEAHKKGKMKREINMVSAQSKKIKPNLGKAEFKPGMSLNGLKKAEEAFAQAESEARELAQIAKDALTRVRNELKKASKDPNAGKSTCDHCDTMAPEKEMQKISIHTLFQKKPDQLREAIKGKGQNATGKVCSNCADLFKEQDN